MNIELHDPLTPIENISHEIIDGNLEAGTYDFWLVSSSISSNQAWNSNPMHQSKFTLYSVVLNQPGGIRLFWQPTDIRHQTTGILWRRNSDEFYWYNINGLLGIVGNSVDFTDYNKRYSSFPFIGRATLLPSPLQKDKGVGKIKILGSSGTITIHEIANELINQNKDNFYYDGDRIFRTIWSLDFRDATGGEFDLSNSYLWTWGGLFLDGSGVLIHTNNISTHRGVGSQLCVAPYMGASQFLKVDKANFSGVIFGSGIKKASGRNVFGYMQIRYTVNTKIENCILIMQYPSLLNAVSIKNTKIFCNTLMSDINTHENEVIGIELLKGHLRLYSKYRSIFRNMKISSGLSYDIRVYFYNVPPDQNRYFEFINASFPERANNVPVIYWNADYNYFYNPIRFSNTFKLSIVDENFMPIKNAKVSISNSSGDTSTYYSDENGIIDTKIVIRTMEKDPSIPNSQTTMLSKIIEYNPFSIKIEKNGFKTYETRVNIQKEIDWQIVLQFIQIPVAEKMEVNIQDGVINFSIDEDILNCEVLEC